ncbi:MFS transporter [Mesorhizobium comanense]|uniref:MFS transporter n=1 Tax=Mesorhizobium comanense TaxID=2502215 RepID=UPI0010F47BE4|nr:MFS transporter [Mesorhizobium comanense]
MNSRVVPTDKDLQPVPIAALSVEVERRDAGWAALLYGANGVRSLALAGGVALHAVNVYIATTILPSVIHDIGGLDLYAWNTTVFVVASILGAALSAKLLRGAGPRGAYAIAAAVFAVGALVCAISPSMPVMLLGRSIQGLGGGFLFALAYAMIRLVFDEALWPRAMALVSGMWGIATLVGPAVGGIFAELGVWRAAFWSLALAAIAFAALAATVLPGRQARSDQRSGVPVKQLIVLVAAVLAISAGSASSDLAWNIGGIVLAVALTMLLVAAERRARWKLLSTGAFQPASAVAALYATMALLAITVTSGEIFVPLFLQVLHGQSPLSAGYLAAIMAAGWTAGSIAGSGAGERGARRLIVAGPLLEVAGMVGLFVLVPKVSAGGLMELAPMCVAFLAVGLGVGVTWPHLMTRAFKAALPGEEELAGASLTTIQLFATALGAALAGMVANAGGLVDPGGVAGTAGAARWLFGAFAVVPLLCVACSRRVIRVS